jgi:beta-glucanase (GH16 family)
MTMQARRNIPTPLRTALAAAILCLAIGAGSAHASPPAGTWHQVFGDEFNGSSLDTGKWSTCYQFGCTNSSNRELEWYQATNDTESGGYLHLTAKHESATPRASKTYDYTSGMVSTGGATNKTPPSFSFKYGYMEMSAQVPAGQGLWPAFWMLPASYHWPPEIDAMEISGAIPSSVDMTVRYSSKQSGYSTQWFTGPNFSAGQHTFGVDWEPSAIVWYIDGVERFRYTTAGRIPNEPMFVLANLAVGGDWPGSPDLTTPFPSEMSVDYIRVYQH